MNASRLALAAAAAAVLITSVQLRRLAAVRKAAVQLRTRAPVVHRPAVFPSDVAEQLNVAAARCGLGALASVELRGAAHERLRVEWQGPTAASLAFLDAADAAGVSGDRLEVASDGKRARWTLEAVPDRRRHASPERWPNVSGDPFIAAPARAAPPRRVAAASPSRKLEAARRAQEEKERAAAEAAAQAARLENRRREVAAGVRLSATMNNGSEPIALADITEAGRRRAVTLRRGDVVLGATVADIDDRAGTMRLDVDGKLLLFPVGGAAHP